MAAVSRRGRPRGWSPVSELREETLFGRVRRWVVIYGLAALPIWFLMTAMMAAPSVDDGVQVTQTITVTSDGEVQMDEASRAAGADWFDAGTRAAAVLLGITLGLALPLYGMSRWSSRRTVVAAGSVELAASELYGSEGWKVRKWGADGQQVELSGKKG